MADETPTPTMISNPFHLAHAISNIKALIPVTLDIKNPNYQKWSHFFIITAGRFCLTDLLLGNAKPTNISADEWQRADYLLQSWIYGTITEDLSSMVLSKTAKAHDLWKALASLFTDNEDYRAIQLEEQFKSLKKGSLSIHDYCQLLKTTADNLADVGNPVSDKQLVLQTLHGLLDDINEAVILDDRDYYYGDEEEKRGWIKYLSFGYSNSGMWILVQLSWRFLLSLIIALFVFYIAAKPPPPNIFIKIGGIGGFRLAEGVDGSGASTKILSCNCSIDLIIENKSKLFGLHINPPFIQLLFGHLPFAVS